MSKKEADASTEEAETPRKKQMRDEIADGKKAIEDAKLEAETAKKEAEAVKQAAETLRETAVAEYAARIAAEKAAEAEAAEAEAVGSVCVCLCQQHPSTKRAKSTPSKVA